MYLSPTAAPRPASRPAIANIRGPRGMGRYLGFGDVNSDAAAKYAAAGYKGVTCAPQVVTYPGGSYTQNQCSDAQGVPLSADLASGMTVAQLQTQLAGETAFNSGNVDSQILALTKNAGGGGQVQYFGPPPSNVNQTWLYTGLQPSSSPPMQTAAVPVPASPPPPAGSSSSGGVSSQLLQVDSAAPAVSSGIDLSFLSGSVSILGMNIPVWAIGGSLLLLPMLFGGGGRR